MCLFDEVDVKDMFGKSLAFCQLLLVASLVHRDRHYALRTVGEDVYRAGGGVLAELDAFDDGSQLGSVVRALAGDRAHASPLNAVRVVD